VPNKPLPKPEQFLKVLDTLNTPGAAKMIDPQSYADMVGQYAYKAYKNDELSYRDYLGIVKPLFGKAGEMVTQKIEERNKELEKYATGGRVKYSSGSDEPDISKLKEKIIELMDKDNLTFEEAYREAREEGYAKGGRVGLQEGKLAQLGNIVDVKNIPYYASKTVEGAVNAGEVLSKLPFAVGNLVSKLSREKPNKEMFLSALNDIQPGSFSEAIGLSDVIARQEENLSPETKTAGSQLSLTSETFIPVGTAINLGNKIIKTASKKLGKDGPKLEKQIDEQLTARGESRRDFNKMVATTGLMASLKALGLSGIKTAGAKADDIKIKLRVSDDAEYIDGRAVDASGYFVQFEPLTKKGKQILETYAKKGEMPEDYFFDNAEDASMLVEKISPKVRSHVDIEIAEPKKLTDDIVVKEEKIGSGKNAYVAKEYSKIYRPGDNPPTADDLDMYGSNIVDGYYNPYGAKVNFRNEFQEDIINQIIKPKKTLDDVMTEAKTGIDKFRTKVKQGIDALEESEIPKVKKASGGRVRYGNGSKPMTKSEKWMRDYFFSGKGGYDDRMSYQEFAIGPGQELFKRFNKKNGGVIYGKYAKQILSS
jgi:hypothetical protein